MGAFWFLVVAFLTTAAIISLTLYPPMLLLISHASRLDPDQTRRLSVLILIQTAGHKAAS